MSEDPETDGWCERSCSDIQDREKLAPKAERLSWECIDEMLLHAPEEVPESQTPAGTRA